MPAPAQKMHDESRSNLAASRAPIASTIPQTPPACQGRLATPTLRRIFDYINTHLEYDLTLVEIAREANLSPYHRKLAAVALSPEDMNLWWVRESGSVAGAQWVDRNWHNYVQAPPNSAHPQGSIAAVSRKPETMEVWWICGDGSVRGTYWYKGMSRAEAKLYVLVPERQASLQGSIAAVSRKPETMEVWWIHSDGSVRGAYWYEGMTGWKHYILAPAGSAATNHGSTLAAVSRKPETMEVWWVAPDGSIRGAYWYEGMTGWKHYILEPEGPASTRGGMAAVSRKSDTMELWYVGADGAVRGAYWYEGMTNWVHYTLAATGASVAGGMAAISRKSETMELWYVGVDASVRGAYWYEGMTDWVHYTLVPSGSVPFHADHVASSSIAAVSRKPETITVFWTGNDGAVNSAEWSE